MDFVRQQRVDPDPLHQPARVMPHRSEIGWAGAGDAGVDERFRRAAQGLGGRFQAQAEQPHGLAFCAAVVDQHRARAGAQRRGHAGGERGQVDHRHRLAAPLHQSRHPRRRAGNLLQPRQRQHLGHLGGIERVVVGAKAEQQEEFHGGGAQRPGAGTGSLDLEARHAAAQVVGDQRQLVDRLARLAQRFHRLLRGLGQLHQRLVDLLGAAGLGLHAFIDHQHARRQRLHLGDDLRQLVAHLRDLGHAAAHFLRELVHAHHAGRHRRLDLAHHLLDVVGCHRGLVGQAADLGGHHGKAAAVFAGLFGFDRGVQRQQVGLVGHLGDGGHHLVDIAGLLVERGQLGVDRAGGIHHMLHGPFHARQPDLPGAGQRRGLLGRARDFVDGAHQVARGGRDLARGRADLRGGGGGFGGGGLLLARGRGNLVDRGGDLDRGALCLADQRSQLAGHLVEAFLHFLELVLAPQRHAQAQVAAADAGQQADDRLHRHRDRAQQQVAAHQRHHHRHDQRRFDADLRGIDGIVDALRGARVDRAVVFDQVLGCLARIDPAVLRFAAQRRGGGGAVPVGLARQDLGRLFVARAQIAIGPEGGPVLFARDGGFVLLLELVQAAGRLLALLLEAAPLGLVGGVDGLPGQHIALAPDAADAGAVVQAGQRVMQHQRGFALDRDQAGIGDHAHQCHHQQDQRKACQDACADGPFIHGEIPVIVLVQGAAGTGKAGRAGRIGTMLGAGAPPMRGRVLYAAARFNARHDPGRAGVAPAPRGFGVYRNCLIFSKFSSHLLNC
ncbi:protein of unknown function (plasmid) [Cupriavidus taiwanensis]|uniref:Uncharacterized protein n=1 Tax=Cupriavidus taiwanensis TaxID=164546 RepID=A0A375IQY2_9BURK|nr:protein of unknown function [Cupriavidus taiwanensis]